MLGSVHIAAVVKINNHNFIYINKKVVSAKITLNHA
jgi:hypothetical protein